ncbi:TPA: hypothetical protein ACHU7F_002113, partial [Streptococcus suis]
MLKIDNSNLSLAKLELSSIKERKLINLTIFIEKSASSGNAAQYPNNIVETNPDKADKIAPIEKYLVDFSTNISSLVSNFLNVSKIKTSKLPLAKAEIAAP